MTADDAEFTSETEGAPMLRVGAVLSTAKVAPAAEAAAAFPAVSVALPEAIVMPTVPSPVHPLKLTVGVFVVAFDIVLAAQVAVPTVLRVTFAAMRLIVFAPV